MRTPNETTWVSGHDAGSAALAKQGSLRPLWLTLAVLVVCAVIYLPFASFAGTGLRAMFIVAAAFAGWQLGLWRGLAAAIIIVPIVLGLTAMAGGDVAGMISTGGGVGAAPYGRPDRRGAAPP